MEELGQQQQQRHARELELEHAAMKAQIAGEIWGDVGRCGEMWGDMGRCGEIWGDMGRCGEMWGDMGRYGEV